MSPRRVRLEARLFRGESVAFEACAEFHAADDPDVCCCGWLVDDHRSGIAAAVPLRVTPHRRAPAARVPARRAS
jgi:hypothetical protein